MSRPDMQREWSEPVLARHLGRVEAPAELWERVRPPRVAASMPRRTLRLAWAVPVAAVLVAAAVWGVQARPDYATAVQALSRGTGNLQFQSNQPDRIRAWVRQNTGLDLPLLRDCGPDVQLAGVRVESGSVEVVYRAGGSEATLIVSKASPLAAAGGRHRFLGDGDYKGLRVASWSMHGNLYNLAYASTGDLRAACGLCHMPSEHLSVVN